MNKKIVRDVIGLAFPSTGEMAVYMLINFFDIMMIGNYGGKIAVSSAGLCYEIMFAVAAIFIDTGLCVGITSLIARNVGAGKHNTAEEYASIGIVTGLLLAFVICFAENQFSFLILYSAGARDVVLTTGAAFMKMLSYAIFVKMTVSVISSILRGHGNTKTPLKVSCIITAINITLDYIFIAGNFGFPELGLSGAAIASLIGQLSGLIYILIYLFRKSLIRPRVIYILKLNIIRLKELVCLSIPSSLEEAAYSISRIFCLFMIMKAGVAAFSANHLANTIESISFMPGAGFGVAATTIVGINVGKRNFKRAKQSAYICAVTGTFIMLICAFLFLVFPTFLIQLFLKENEYEVIRLGAKCLMIGAVEQPSIGIALVFAGSLRGYGDTKTPFLISLATSWLIRVPLIFWFIYIKNFSVTCVWWITAIQWTVDGILMFLFFRKRISRRLL